MLAAWAALLKCSVSGPLRIFAHGISRDSLDYTVGQPLDTIKTRAQVAPEGMFVSTSSTLTIATLSHMRSERAHGHSKADAAQRRFPCPIQRSLVPFCRYNVMLSIDVAGMASPLAGIAGVNSLLFAAYGISKRIISPFPQLSLKEIAAAGAMAGAANAILASPGLF